MDRELIECLREAQARALLVEEISITDKLEEIIVDYDEDLKLNPGD